MSQEAQFPVNVRSGINTSGKKVHYYFNYSNEHIEQKYLHEEAVELISGIKYEKGQLLSMQPWGVLILEEQ